MSTSRECGRHADLTGCVHESPAESAGQTAAPHEQARDPPLLLEDREVADV
jgi:hypothetical protein